MKLNEKFLEVRVKIKVKQTMGKGEFKTAVRNALAASLYHDRGQFLEVRVSGPVKAQYHPNLLQEDTDIKFHFR